jgi:signal transduction histidine kinase
VTSTERDPAWSERLNPRNWSLAAKLVAVGLVPTLLALVLGVLRISDQAGVAAQLGEDNRLLDIRAGVTETSQALQAERNAAVLFVAGGRQGDRGALDQAVAASDASLDRVRGALGDPALLDASSSTALQNAEGGFTQLPVLRSESGNSVVGTDDVRTRYTSIIERAAVLERALIRQAATADGAGLGDALTATSEAREALALQHTTLAGAIVAGELREPDRIAVTGTDAAFTSAFADYQVALTPDQLGSYGNFATDAANVERERLRTEIMATPAGRPVAADAAAWDTAYTNSVAVVDRSAQGVGGELDATSVAAQENASNQAGVNSVILMLGVLLGIAIIVLLARSLIRSLRVLRRSALDVAERKLPAAVDSMRAGQPLNAMVEPVPLSGRDEVGQVARAFDAVHGQAIRLAADQAALQSNVSNMFVNLSRRSQALVERQLQLIEQLESNEQDPDQLSNLFQLDHLATRMRRNSENLLVLAGTDLTKRNVAPVPVVDVLRAAVSEIEQYQRVVVQPPPVATVAGRAASDLVHLLAELLDNATNFSPPDSQVVMSTTRANDGSLFVEIADRGVGMADHELSEANQRLSQPAAVDVSASRRMGLFVVGRLANRHGLGVRLGGGVSGGTGGGLTASVTVPANLVPTAEPVDRRPARAGAPAGAVPASAFGGAPALPAPSGSPSLPEQRPSNGRSLSSLVAGDDGPMSPAPAFGGGRPPAPPVNGTGLPQRHSGPVPPEDGADEAPEPPRPAGPERGPWPVESLRKPPTGDTVTTNGSAPSVPSAFTGPAELPKRTPRGVNGASRTEPGADTDGSSSAGRAAGLAAGAAAGIAGASALRRGDDGPKDDENGSGVRPAGAERPSTPDGETDPETAAAAEFGTGEGEPTTRFPSGLPRRSPGSSPSAPSALPRRGATPDGGPSAFDEGTSSPEAGSAPGGLPTRRPGAAGPGGLPTRRPGSSADERTPQDRGATAFGAGSSGTAGGPTAPGTDSTSTDSTSTDSVDAETAGRGSAGPDDEGADSSTRASGRGPGSSGALDGLRERTSSTSASSDAAASAPASPAASASEAVGAAADSGAGRSSDRDAAEGDSTPATGAGALGAAALGSTALGAAFGGATRDSGTSAEPTEERPEGLPQRRSQPPSRPADRRPALGSADALMPKRDTPDTSAGRLTGPPAPRENPPIGPAGLPQRTPRRPRQAPTGGTDGLFAASTPGDNQTTGQLRRPGGFASRRPSRAESADAVSSTAAEAFGQGATDTGPSTSDTGAAALGTSRNGIGSPGTDSPGTDSPGSDSLGTGVRGTDSLGRAGERNAASAAGLPSRSDGGRPDRGSSSRVIRSTGADESTPDSALAGTDRLGSDTATGADPSTGDRRSAEPTGWGSTRTGTTGLGTNGLGTNGLAGTAHTGTSTDDADGSASADSVAGSARTSDPVGADSPASADSPAGSASSDSPAGSASSDSPASSDGSDSPASSDGSARANSPVSANGSAGADSPAGGESSAGADDPDGSVGGADSDQTGPSTGPIRTTGISGTDSGDIGAVRTGGTSAGAGAGDTSGAADTRAGVGGTSGGDRGTSGTATSGGEDGAGSLDGRPGTGRPEPARAENGRHETSRPEISRPETSRTRPGALPGRTPGANRGPRPYGPGQDAPSQNGTAHDPAAQNGTGPGGTGSNGIGANGTGQGGPVRLGDGPRANEDGRRRPTPFSAPAPFAGGAFGGPAGRPPQAPRPNGPTQNGPTQTGPTPSGPPQNGNGHGGNGQNGQAGVEQRQGPAGLPQRPTRPPQADDAGLPGSQGAGPAPSRPSGFDLGQTTPIFEEIASAWFRSNGDLPVKWAESTPEAEQPPVFATAADEGWRVADATAQATAAESDKQAETTDAGLPKRRPRARLVPGNAAGSAVLAPPSGPARNAEAIRGRLASYQQGVRQGRESRLRSRSAQGPNEQQNEENR